MKKSLLIAGLFGFTAVSTLASVTSYAQALKLTQITATEASLKAQPKGTYNIEPTHTTVVWRLTHMGLSNYTARFDKISGTIDFDPAKVTSSKANIAIETKSVSTGLPKFDQEIAEKFLNSEKNPTINFVTTSLVKTGPVTGKMNGNLTLNGVTKPVSLNVVFNGGKEHPFAKKQALGFSASGSFKRSDFGVNNFIPMIGDNIDVIIEVEAIKQ